MKYSDMTPEQKREYGLKQMENQRVARLRAKQNTVIINITVDGASPELIALINANKESK